MAPHPTPYLPSHNPPAPPSRHGISWICHCKVTFYVNNGEPKTPVVIHASNLSVNSVGRCCESIHSSLSESIHTDDSSFRHISSPYDAWYICKYFPKELSDLWCVHIEHSVNTCSPTNATNGQFIWNRDAVCKLKSIPGPRQKYYNLHLITKCIRGNDLLCGRHGHPAGSSVNSDRFLSMSVNSDWVL